MRVTVNMSVIAGVVGLVAISPWLNEYRKIKRGLPGERFSFWGCTKHPREMTIAEIAKALDAPPGIRDAELQTKFEKMEGNPYPGLAQALEERALTKNPEDKWALHFHHQAMERLYTTDCRLLKDSVDVSYCKTLKSELRDRHQTWEKAPSSFDTIWKLRRGGEEFYQAGKV